MSPDERLTAVLLEHGKGPRVSSREHWIGCLCGERLPCQLDSDGYAVEDDGDDRAFAAHTAAVLRDAGYVHRDDVAGAVQ